MRTYARHLRLGSLAMYFLVPVLIGRLAVDMFSLHPILVVVGTLILLGVILSADAYWNLGKRITGVELNEMLPDPLVLWFMYAWLAVVAAGASYVVGQATNQKVPAFTMMLTTYVSGTGAYIVSQLHSWPHRAIAPRAAPKVVVVPSQTQCSD